jgi:RNA polymerase sigma factor (sigma-70 family)
LRDVAPQVLGAVVRRYRDFAASEDAVQEALIAAATQWPRDGTPENPRGWLIHVALRRMSDHVRSESSRRQRESAVADETPTAVAPEPYVEPGIDPDDTLILLFMCCHPSLTPSSAIALTLRAVGGLTTTEIARAFLVPEATMAQRISRAKQSIRTSGVPFRMPDAEERTQRLVSVLHVLYLIFNEGYTTTAGPALHRADLSGEAIRLMRAVHRLLPDDPEVAGLLALMLLTDARRAARSGPEGELIPLDEQDRTLWDRDAIAEGTALVEGALSKGAVGEYQLQAAIAAVHDEAARAGDTDWPQILALYELLRRMSGNPMVALNHAIAAAMVDGPQAGLELLKALDADDRLAGHYRLAAVRAHLHEMAGEPASAVAHYRKAAEGTSNMAERDYLRIKAARLALVLGLVLQGCATSAANWPISTTELSLQHDAGAPAIVVQRAYGGAGSDDAYDIRAASGGYVIVGSTQDPATEDLDVAVIRVDADGVPVWSRSHGGDALDIGFAARVLADGTIVVAGWTRSFGAGEGDYYLLGLDANGGKKFERSFGGAGEERATGMLVTSDDGLAIVGESYVDGDSRFYLVRTDAAGELQWERRYDGGALNERGLAIVDTGDGFLLAGNSMDTTSGSSATVSDGYAVRTDYDGNMLWSRRYGGDAHDIFHHAVRVDAGRYLLTGYTRGFGAKGPNDVWIVTIDGAGEPIAQALIGGDDADHDIMASNTPDGGVLLSGYTRSASAGGWDVLVAKLDASAALEWSQRYGGAGDDGAVAAIATESGDVVVAGYTESAGAQGRDILFMRLGLGAGVGHLCPVPELDIPERPMPVR